MFKLKFVLPMLAFVLAIGMSFAFVNTADEELYVTKHILTSQGWMDISVQCPQGSADCIVRFEDDPSQTDYQVYDSESLQDPTEGTGNIINLPGDVPNREL